MDFKDTKNSLITDGDLLLFTHADTQEKGGYSRHVTNVKLCFWSANENRYIPFSELSDNEQIDYSEIVQNKANIAK